MTEVLIDPIRSARFGEQIPTAAERARLRREGVEHINVNGDLEVKGGSRGSSLSTSARSHRPRRSGSPTAARRRPPSEGVLPAAR